MRRPGKLCFVRDILSTFQLFPVDYFCRRYCVFQEDAIMTQQTTPRLQSVVATTTACFILAMLCCLLPGAYSMGSDCYTITGRDYRGTQDKIGLPPEAADFLADTECLPWNTSVESTKPRARERGIGDHNYCRNPDMDILPWCKIAGIQGSEGAWGYCHLPSCQVPGYVGCYPNRGRPSALNGIGILHKDMTVGACIDFCRRNDYKYAGLEAGHACYCGNRGYSRYGSPADRGTQCATKCFGNKLQPCGGDGFVDVYLADIGSCKSGSALRAPSGAVYSPGYPDYPGSPAMMTSLSATEFMMRKRRDAMKEEDMEVSEIDAKINERPKKPEEKCEWRVVVKKASEIKLLIRKIDPKRKLGGVIEIEAADDATVTVATSPTSNVTSPVVWITESTESRHDVDAVIPNDNLEGNGNYGPDASAKRPQWSAEHAKRRWTRRTLPASSFESRVSIMGGVFTVRFLRNSDLLASLKSALEFPRTHSRSRRRQASAEWSRFVVEYEANFPEGVTFDPDNDVIDTDDDTVFYGVEDEETNGESKRNNRRPKHAKTVQDKKESRNGDILVKTKFSISQEDALVIKQAVSSQSVGFGSDVTQDQGSNSPIKIEVFVEPVDASSDKSSDEKSPMSEFMVPLLLAVFLATTAILILTAVLVCYRRGGLTSKKHQKQLRDDYSRGLVVACPRDGGTEKSASNLNLYSSTADSVLLTDAEMSQYSQGRSYRVSPPVSAETTIKDLMEFLKNQPGLIRNHPSRELDQRKQTSQLTRFDSHRDDVTAIPGPCAHCCGCAEDNDAHRHGDSCRVHYNQVKCGRAHGSSLSRSGGGKNPKGLSIRAGKAGPQPFLAPPLSPISEVSSVTSSMTSLPITSANSQTSLLRNAPKSGLPQKAPKKDRSEKAPDGEALLAAEDESGNAGSSRYADSRTSNDATRQDRKSEKLISKRYLGGVAGACYDSGYATSNYEEEEEKAGSDVAVKDNLSLSNSVEADVSNLKS